jgi:hypothetical protein
MIEDTGLNNEEPSEEMTEKNVTSYMTSSAYLKRA